MDNLFVAAEDIEADTDCTVIVRVNDKPFIASVGVGRNGETIGTSTDAIPKGRKAQLVDNGLTLTDDERVYTVMFSLD